MNTACKVSLYCTAYNHENYIRQALDSFLAQKTDFPFEVLVTDDASTDSTPAILREYGEKYPEIIRYFHQEKNLFQQGIDVCQAVMYPNTRGKYVAFCEGDDYLTDSVVEKLSDGGMVLSHHALHSVNRTDHVGLVDHIASAGSHKQVFGVI